MTPSGKDLLPIAMDVLKYLETQSVSYDELLDDLKAQFEPRIVGGVNALMMSYFRHRTKIESMLYSFGGHFKPRYIKFLGLVVAQMKYCDGIPEQAVAHMAIEEAKAHFGIHTAKWMNAVLRYIQPLDLNAFEDLYPQEFQKSRAHLSKETQQFLLKVELIPPPFTFRKMHIDQPLDEALEATALELDFLPQNLFYTTLNPSSIIESQSLKMGMIYIQDPATFFLFSLLKKQSFSPQKILDACAAPGGKALLAATVFEPQKMVVFDRSARRQKRTLENINLRRTLFPQTIFDVQSELLQVDTLFDLVIIDAPCSNSGVIRHRPDAMYRYNLEQMEALNQLQVEILNEYAKYVEVGGFLAFSTCSISDAENHRSVGTFLSQNSAFTCVEQHTLLPSQLHDGAFVALLRRSV